MNRALITPSIALSVLLIGGCDRQPTPASPAETHERTPAPTNRVAVPAAVRSNLGITFVKVERRRVEQTLRVPGRFEYTPTARREYRMMLPGRVELLARQFDVVQEGDPLYRIDSPAWREHQQRLTEAEASIERLETRLASFGPLREAHRAHESKLEQTIEIRRERVGRLESLAAAGGGRWQDITEALDAVATAEADLAEVLETEAQLEAEEAGARSDLRAARARLRLLLDAASSITGVSVEDLQAPAAGLERWRTLRSIDVVAEQAGTIESIALTNGAWATQEAAVLTVVRPNEVRFHASGLQSDLGVLRDGLTAHIVPPTPTAGGRAVPLDQSMSGTLRLGLAADADDRTIEMYVTPQELLAWARSGVSAQLEIVTDATAQPVLSIPMAAVQRDGLAPVIFRRAPDNPNEVIRMEADLGLSDGRWVAVLSGLREGDEVVLDGAFQLMLATSGSVQKGGHFHSDGTFHEEEH